MRRKVVVMAGAIKNGVFEPYENSKKVVPYNKAKNMEWNLRDEASDQIHAIGGRSKMAKDHYVFSAELYGPRGGLREVHLILSGRDVSEEDFEKFIQPYSYVGAYHK